MGAQSLPPEGTAITLDQSELELDKAAGVYRVSAGARWGEVIRRLDAEGWSPAVMQSNNDFGVASTFCVNAHGWPVVFGPFGSTVRSLRMMLASGDVVTCTREQQHDLFRATMGGYGLTGVILDLDVEMVRNELLTPSYEQLPFAAFAERFVAAANRPEVRMSYGRLDVTLGRFLDEALLVSYRPAADQSDIPPAVGSGFLSHASRWIFRSQLDSDLVKSIRWDVETSLAPRLYGATTRNSLLNEPVVTLDDRDPARTDILHEYFVAPERFADFIAACKDVIPASYQDLLNVTLRYVAHDRDSVLAYATAPRIAAVMLFSQEMSLRAEEDMARMTRALIERTLDIGGSYYLPYRPHATRAQFERAYPRHGEFAALKAAFDPAGLFMSPFWERYLGNGTRRP